MEDFMRKKAELDENEGYFNAFMSLREAGEIYKIQFSSQESSLPQNLPKNRYKDILPFDETRVKLAPFDDDPNSDYINATYIRDGDGKRGYIASQGPLANTVDDYWRMLWQEKIRVIIMACREYEGIPPKMKCMKYWPESSDSDQQFGEIIVSFLKEEEYDNFVIRHICAQLGEERRNIVQLHYLSWPDRGVPDCLDSVLHIIKAARGYQESNSPPLLVHCSAGCGRTGTIIVLDYIRNLILTNRVNGLDVHDVMDNMRRQRPAMVQTLDQYQLVFQGVEELLKQNLPSGQLDGIYENTTVSMTDSSERLQVKRPPLPNSKPANKPDKENSSEQLKRPPLPNSKPANKPDKENSSEQVKRPLLPNNKPANKPDKENSKPPNEKLSKPSKPALESLPTKPKLDRAESVANHNKNAFSVDLDPDKILCPTKNHDKLSLKMSVESDYTEAYAINTHHGGHEIDDSPPPIPDKTEESAESYSYAENNKHFNWGLPPNQNSLYALLNDGPKPTAPIRIKKKPTSPIYSEVKDFGLDCDYAEVGPSTFPAVKSPSVPVQEITFRQQRMDYPHHVSGKPLGGRSNPFL